MFKNDDGIDSHRVWFSIRTTVCAHLKPWMFMSPSWMFMSFCSLCSFLLQVILLFDKRDKEKQQLNVFLVKFLVKFLDREMLPPQNDTLNDLQLVINKISWVYTITNRSKVMETKYQIKMYTQQHIEVNISFQN